MTRNSLPFLSLLLAVCAGCSTVKVPFDPPASGENEIARVHVYEVRLKKEKLTVYTRIDNLAEDNLVVEKGSYKLDVDGKTHGGTKGNWHAGFSIPAHFVEKKIHFVFPGVREMPASAKFRIVNMVVKGKEGQKHDVEIALDLGGAAQTEEVYEVPSKEPSGHTKPEKVEDGAD